MTITENSHALIFGINYVDSSENSRLNGCVNDAMNVREFLVDNLKVPYDNCRVYTDTSPGTKKWTTAQGILQALNEVATMTWQREVDFLWIHFSGHGTYCKDDSGDEKDGQDEMLVPSDYEKVGCIPDDYVQSILANINPRTRVLFVSDCCHSGTVSDLTFQITPMRDGTWKTVKQTSGTAKECKALVMSLSGCTDKQTSADAHNVANDWEFTGAMTSCLLLVLKAQQAQTPKTRFNVLRVLLDLRGELKHRNFSQVPQLCCSKDIWGDANRDNLFVLPLSRLTTVEPPAEIKPTPTFVSAPVTTMPKGNDIVLLISVSKTSPKLTTEEAILLGRKLSIGELLAINFGWLKEFLAKRSRKKVDEEPAATV